MIPQKTNRPFSTVRTGDFVVRNVRISEHCFSLAQGQQSIRPRLLFSFPPIVSRRAPFVPVPFPIAGRPLLFSPLVDRFVDGFLQHSPSGSMISSTMPFSHRIDDFRQFGEAILGERFHRKFTLKLLHRLACLFFACKGNKEDTILLSLNAGTSFSSHSVLKRIFSFRERIMSIASKSSR